MNNINKHRIDTIVKLFMTNKLKNLIYNMIKYKYNLQKFKKLVTKFNLLYVYLMKKILKSITLSRNLKRRE